MKMMKYKFCFKAVFVMLLVLMGIDTFSQKSIDSVVYIYKSPVNEGYIQLFQDNSATYRDPASYITIFSKESDVFAVMEGRVTRIFSLDEADYIMVKSGDTTIVYGSMENITKKTGDIIHKGDLIGKIKRDLTSDNYELVFMIIVGRKYMLYDEHIKFLKQNK